jgi:prepilin-type N-terminal cleavage/methylation domain-containing protein
METKQGVRVMKVRNQISHARGFTLVEMLVVITIISILAALLIPGITMALSSAQKARNGTEISSLMMALERYKSENGGQYPPSFGEAQAQGTTYAQMHSSCTHKNTILYRYVTSAYPRISDNDLAYLFQEVADNLDQSSALVFWLSQTTNDARYPFTSTSGTKRSYFTFDEKRFGQLHTIAAITNKSVSSCGANIAYNAPALILNGYHPPYGNDSYYAYLEAKHYPSYTSGNFTAAQTTANTAKANGLTFRPYLKNTLVDTNNLTLGNYVNSDSYQLICAGLDGQFMAEVTHMRKFPCGSVGTDEFDQPMTLKDFQDDRDNQTNFTEGRALGDVQP